jgi:hypothetical protein
MLVHPSSEVCDLFVELFNVLYCFVRIEVLALAYLFDDEITQKNKSEAPENGCTSIPNMLSIK